MMNKEFDIFSGGKCLSFQELIDYKNNALNRDEQHRVEKHLLDCQLCSDALDGLDKISPEELREDVEHINRNINQSNKLGRKIITYVSAAAILLIGISFLLNQFDKNKTGELFDKYYNLYPDVTLHERSSSNNSTFTEAMNYYNTGDFDKALNLLIKLKDEKNKETIDFYTASIYLKTNNLQKAKNILLSLSSDTAGNFYYESNWYLALIELKLDNISESKKYLSRLHDSVDYSNLAKNLLEEIKFLE